MSEASRLLRLFTAPASTTTPRPTARQQGPGQAYHPTSLVHHSPAPPPRQYPSRVATVAAPNAFMRRASAQRAVSGSPPASCVALEDSPNGIAAANTAGMRCVAVPGPLLQADPGYQRADLVLPSLAMLDWTGSPSAWCVRVRPLAGSLDWHGSGSALRQAAGSAGVLVTTIAVARWAKPRIRSGHMGLCHVKAR
jgi:hypothetical protein